MEKRSELQERLDLILSGPRGEAPRTKVHRTERSFSAYVDTDVEAAAALAKRLGTIIAAGPDAATGVQRALDAAEEELARETIGGTVQYALKLLLTHDKTARRLLSLRPLEKRQPNAIRSPVTDNHEKE
jgi:hypothetical protein